MTDVSGANFDRLQIADRVMIQDLVSRYAFLGDYGSRDEWVDLFTPTAEWELPALGAVVRNHDGLGRLFDIVREFAPGINHLQSNLIVDVNGTIASGRVALNEFLLRPRGIFSNAHGWYEDNYESVGGRWRFVRRRLHLTADGISVMTSGEIGTFMSPMLNAFAEAFVDNSPAGRG